MAKYIDAEKFIQRAQKAAGSLADAGERDISPYLDIAVCSFANAMPAEDVAPVIHATWVAKTEISRNPYARNYICSNCGYAPLETTKYCGGCGAKMKDEGTEDV